MGTQRGWRRSPSDAGPLPPPPPRGTGPLHAEEPGRCRPWSGSLSGPGRAGSTLSSPTTGTSLQALWRRMAGIGVQPSLPWPQPSLRPWAASPHLPWSGVHIWARQVCAGQPALRAGAGRGTQAQEGEGSSVPPGPPHTPLLIGLPFPPPGPISLWGLSHPPRSLVPPAPVPCPTQGPLRCPADSVPWGNDHRSLLLTEARQREETPHCRPLPPHSTRPALQSLPELRSWLPRFPHLSDKGLGGLPQLLRACGSLACIR